MSGTGVSPVRALSPDFPGTGETPPGTGETPVLLNSRTAGGDSIGAMADRLEGIEKQVVKLREELVRYEDRVRLHDVLGGIGCILGLMGLTFYFLGVRRREKAAAAKS
jgi:nickel transport protein